LASREAGELLYGCYEAITTRAACSERSSYLANLGAGTSIARLTPDLSRTVKEVSVKRAVIHPLPVAFVLLAPFITACAGDDNFGNANSRRTHRPDTWRVIAAGPIKSDYGHKGVWTGKEQRADRR
jgi:hypothetical protein